MSVAPMSDNLHRQLRQVLDDKKQISNAVNGCRICSGELPQGYFASVQSLVIWMVPDEDGSYDCSESKMHYFKGRFLGEQRADFELQLQRPGSPMPPGKVIFPDDKTYHIVYLRAHQTILFSATGTRWKRTVPLWILYTMAMIVSNEPPPAIEGKAEGREKRESEINTEFEKHTLLTVAIEKESKQWVAHLLGRKASASVKGRGLTALQRANYQLHSSTTERSHNTMMEILNLLKGKLTDPEKDGKDSKSVDAIPETSPNVLSEQKEELEKGTF
jgi:hypothetical protein